MLSKIKISFLLSFAFASVFAWGGPGDNFPKGLNPDARDELIDAGVTKYVGMYSPASSQAIGDGWVKHTFDTDDGNGPICIAGTPFTAFTKAQNPSRLLVYLNGGGACWQNFYFCSILANDDPPAPSGIFATSIDTGAEVITNPIGDWSVVYLSYCDGSVFTGDNDVFDPNFPFSEVRYHRGLRNLTAGVDLAKSMFPHASRILVAGSSAGGVGAAGFAPFLTRMAYGNNKAITVFNDAGPVATNPDDVANNEQRAYDWQFGQFYPASCTECDASGQATALIDWRLSNDNTVREAFYSTDGDQTDRFFLNVPTQEAYRELILEAHGILNEAYPERYKRFIRSGDTSHTSLRGSLFYTGTANGVPLYEWMDDFLVPRPFWVDIVEDFVPAP